MAEDATSADDKTAPAEAGAVAERTLSRRSG